MKEKEKFQNFIKFIIFFYNKKKKKCFIVKIKTGFKEIVKQNIETNNFFEFEDKNTPNNYSLEKLKMETTAMEGKDEFKNLVKLAIDTNK